MSTTAFTIIRTKTYLLERKLHVDTKADKQSTQFNMFNTKTLQLTLSWLSKFQKHFQSNIIQYQLIKFDQN